MPPHTRVLETVRRTRAGVYVVATLYVAVGLFLSARAAVHGEILDALVGLLIVSGAMGGAFVLLAALRLGLRMSVLVGSLEDVRKRLDRIDGVLRASPTPQDAARAVEMMNLSAAGLRDVNSLTAATLDRDKFPRLVSTMDDARVAERLADGLSESAAGRADVEPGAVDEAAAADLALDSDGAMPDSGLASRNLLRQWKMAMRNGDLVGCRSVYAALVDTADPELVARLDQDLLDLGGRIEEELRTEFSQCVQNGNFAGAIRAGERICTQLPASGIAHDYEQLEPHLKRRLTRVAGQ